MQQGAVILRVLQRHLLYNLNRDPLVYLRVVCNLWLGISYSQVKSSKPLIPSIWDLESPSKEFEGELHGFNWLDHLAAEGSFRARTLAKEWLWQWIAEHGNGNGAGWTPQLTGRRVVRVINHALMLLAKEEKQAQQKYFKALGQQAYFLWKRWRSAPEGLPRFEALTGLVYCGLALEGKEKYLHPAMKLLARECESYIDKDGGIPSRNPEELMNIFTSLAWAAHAIGEAGLKPERDHLLAMERIVPTLRALRLGRWWISPFSWWWAWHGRAFGSILVRCVYSFTCQRNRCNGLCAYGSW